MKFTRLDLSMILLGIFAIGFWLIAPQFPTEEEQRFLKESNEPLQCADREQCSKYWEHATQWVHKNSKYGVMTETNDVIETYNPIDGSKNDKLSYKAFKKAGDHATVIDIEVDCNRWFDGCSPSPAAARAAFKQYVKYGIN